MSSFSLSLCEALVSSATLKFMQALKDGKAKQIQAPDVGACKRALGKYEMLHQQVKSIIDKAKIENGIPSTVLVETLPQKCL